VAAERADAAATVADDALVAEYEALRRQLGGVAVAPLTDSGACGGCHLVLSAMERDRIKKLPDDARVTCEECGRLLVR
jgi:predicted  nucleic acid-binding Zn-ribbon protein